MTFATKLRLSVPRQGWKPEHLLAQGNWLSHSKDNLRVSRWVQCFDSAMANQNRQYKWLLQESSHQRSHLLYQALEHGAQEYLLARGSVRCELLQKAIQTRPSHRRSTSTVSPKANSTATGRKNWITATDYRGVLRERTME